MSSSKGEVQITNSTGKAYFDFKKALAEVTDGIVNAATEALDEAKQDGALFAVQELRAESMSHGWHNYYKGWTSKAVKSRKQTRYIVHNKDYANLTHLLENGHRIITVNGEDTGKRTKAIKHILPVYEKVPEVIDEAFTKRLKDKGL